MAFSMYNLTVPVMLHSLDILSGYMDKAAAYAVEKDIDPTVLINARLAPDMFPLAGQVQRISDNCKGAMARLAAVQAPSFPDTETTFAQLQERISKTATFLRTIKPEQLAGSEDRTIELKFRNGSTTMNGRVYLLSVLLPNLFFHLTTAHDILRHNGMSIGKMDYLGNIK